MKNHFTDWGTCFMVWRLQRRNYTADKPQQACKPKAEHRNSRQVFYGKCLHVIKALAISAINRPVAAPAPSISAQRCHLVVPCKRFTTLRHIPAITASERNACIFRVFTGKRCKMYMLVLSPSWMSFLQTSQLWPWFRLPRCLAGSLLPFRHRIHL